MKTLNFWQPLIIAAIAVTPLLAQDSAEELVEEGATILDDPRFKNMFRQVQEDPGKAATDAIQKLKANSDKAENAVRDATRVIQDNQDQIEGAAQTLQENRSTIEAAANMAMEEFNNMAPAATPSGADAPATRPARNVSTLPIAQPTTSDSTAVPKPTATVVDQPIVQNTQVTPIATAPTTESSIPDSPFLNPGDFPEPTPVAPMYRADNEGAFQNSSSNEIVITSGASEMDNNAGVITFTENVIINYPDPPSTLECEKLVVTLADKSNPSESGSNSSIKSAVATGGTVKIRRISPEGTQQIAISRMAEYNGLTEDFVLSGGPPYIQDGEKHIRCTEPGAQIVMTGDGKYKINGSNASAPSRHKISFPVEDKGGNKTIGIGNSVGGSLDRLR